MGLLDFNITEIASRFVRGSAVRGRIRPTLDDGILGVAQVADWTRAPFRLDEQKYFAAVATPSFNAADGHGIGIMNNSRLPIVLEWWRCLNRTNAAARVEAGYYTKAVMDAMANQNDTAFRSLENGGILGVVRNDIVLRTGRNGGASLPQAATLVDTFDLPSNAGSSSWAPSAPQLDLVIPAGVGFMFIVPAVGVSVTLSCQIRVINNVSIQP